MADIWVIAAFICISYLPLQYIVTRLPSLNGLVVFTLAIFFTSSYSYLYEECYPNVDIAVINVYVYSVSLLELIKRQTNGFLMKAFLYLTGLFACVYYSHFIFRIPCFETWNESQLDVCDTFFRDLGIICLIIIIIAGLAFLADPYVQELIEPEDQRDHLGKVGKELVETKPITDLPAIAQEELEIPRIHISTAYDSKEKRPLLVDETA